MTAELLSRDEFQQRLKELQHKQFPALSDGHVALVDCMGTDQDIVDAARISYGAGTQRTSKDRHLVRYLMRQRHSTPFEMVEFKFRVRVPMDTWRQWIRHRTASVNEYSTRYSEAIDSKDKTMPHQWRLQATRNKQGSVAGTIEWPVGVNSNERDAAEYLSLEEAELHEHAEQVYQERLAFGIAREQARKDLPLSTYTEAYWKIDLHNLLHFLGLRMDSHAQLEIRTYADIIGNQIVSQLVPVAWEAFKDYRLNALQLTALDVAQLNRLAEYLELIRGLRTYYAAQTIANNLLPEWQLGVCRERHECLGKLVRLGLLPPELPDEVQEHMERHYAESKNST